MIIRNAQTLCCHGNIDGRKIILAVLEAGLAASDPYDNTSKLIRIRNGKLIVGNKCFPVEQRNGQQPPHELVTIDLKKIGNIFLVGGGKAAQRMGKAVEDVLGDRITEGNINAKKGEPKLCNKVNVTFAGHPIPDEDSVKGAEKIVEIYSKAKKDDIIFSCESGGATALATMPAPGLTLEDIQEVTRLVYFECGASIMETNVVRVPLIVRPRYLGDATFVCFSTDPMPLGLGVYLRRYRGRHGSLGAIDVLMKFDLWDRVPQSVRTYLKRLDPLYGVNRHEKLKGKPQYYYRVIGPETMLNAAKKKAEELGIYAPIIASSPDDIEARPFGETLACVAQEVECYSRPFKPPCIMICGGELLVTVGKSTGCGGRNQEFALATAPKIEGSKKIVVASVDSDGTDGPTEMAGGIVDGYTMERAKKTEVDVAEELANHNSYAALKKLEDNILTGARGTNVQDLTLVYIARIPDHHSKSIRVQGLY